MLQGLSIHDVVLIDRLDLGFENGLSALTGETGAGKSILLDALGLALGARADAGLVAKGATQATVAASFALDARHPARALLAEGGRVLIVDERVGEQFVAPGDDVERFMYAWSTLYCLPASMAEPPSAATGAVMRPDTLRRYAMEAGFREVDVVPIEDPFWRFYVLRP